MAALASLAVTTMSTAATTTTNPLAGKTCYALGSTLTIPGPTYAVKYTCVRVGTGKTAKLVYDAGVRIPNPPSLPTGNFDTTPGGPLIWSETFTGSAGSSPIVPSSTFNNTWTPVTGATGYGTGELENNTTSPQNLSVDGQGDLDITARCVSTCTTANQGAGSWTSARIWTNGKLDFQYGQLEAKIWMPAGSYNWPAFWMMGQNYTSLKAGVPSVNWPYCGELDIAEGLQGNSQDQATIHSNIPNSSTDWAGGSGFTQIAPITSSQMSGGWHTYGVLWKPDFIAYTLDGKVWGMDTYNETTKDVTQTILNSDGKTTSSLTVGPGTGISSSGGDWPFNAPFFVVMDDAIGGVSSPIAPTNSATATMQVAWLKYYGYAGYGSVTQYTSKN
jgi:beta-glucanase (GH16 family)